MKYSIVIGLLFLLASESWAMQPSAQKFPVDKEIGIWFWQSPTKFTEAELRDKFLFAQQEGITAIYASIDEYVDIFEIEDNALRQKEEKKFIQKVERFNKLAREQGIVVHALAGHEKWANVSHRYIPERLLQFVIEYNAMRTSETRFKGMQFDIEPYAQPSFRVTPARILGDYLDTAKSLANTVKRQSPDLYLGFAVPYWMDGATRGEVVVTWQGKKKAAVFHLLDTLQPLQRGYIVVMDYRVATGGKNGSIALVKEELDYARTYAKSARVLIGQETSYVEPSSITFYNRTKRNLRTATHELAAAYGHIPNFRGFAIHQFNSYRRLAD